MYGLSTPLICFISRYVDIVSNAYDISIYKNWDHVDFLVKMFFFCE